MTSAKQKIERLIHLCFSLSPPMKEALLSSLESIVVYEAELLLEKLQKLKKHEEEQIANLSPSQAEQIFNDIQMALKKEREKEEVQESIRNEQKEEDLLSQL
ncbi:hypothetical protein HON22_00445 [Candidatus Peregrinibacteria bacterium]|jgi:hypothetical protein|nr:hypothetical protein [Candidatus Peregrinibacteria bacterium]